MYRIPLNGMGARKLAHEAKISVHEAQDLLRKYWAAFPKVKAFFDGFVANAIANRVVRSPYDNRMRWLEASYVEAAEDEESYHGKGIKGFDFDSKKDLARIRNMCMNYPMQSGNASITKLALINLRKEIKQRELPVQIICNIHDEILLNSHKSVAEEAEAMLTRVMQDSAEIYVKNVKIKVESAIAPYWKK